MEKIRPGRKRSEATRQKILDAALSLAIENASDGVTMEGIAARAGVGKQTLYRWWSTPSAMILEALMETGRTQIPIPETDDPRADLQAFLVTTFQVLNTPVGNVVRRLMARAQEDPAFAAAFREQFIVYRRAALLTVLRRLAPDQDAELLADFIFGAMWYRLLVGHAPLDDAFAAQVAENLPGGHSASPNGARRRR